MIRTLATRSTGALRATRTFTSLRALNAAGDTGATRPGGEASGYVHSIHFDPYEIKHQQPLYRGEINSIEVVLGAMFARDHVKRIIANMTAWLACMAYSDDQEETRPNWLEEDNTVKSLILLTLLLYNRDAFTRREKAAEEGWIKQEEMNKYVVPQI